MHTEPAQEPHQILCRAILFDCDGVLLDSNAAIRRVLRVWCQHHEIDEHVILSSARGGRAEDTVRRAAPHLNVEKAVEHLTTLEEHDTHDIQALPGARALMAELPTNQWAVVTSAATRVCQARIAAAELTSPPVLVAAEDVSASKPSPQGYMIAAQGLGVPANDCVVIDDSLVGVQAGRAAGALVIRIGDATIDRGDFAVPDLRHVAIQHDRDDGWLRITIPPASL